MDTLLEGVETAAEYVTAFCDGDYTTNLPLEDVTGGKAWVAYAYEGDIGAFTKLVRDNSSLVYRVALRMLGNDDAQDASQDV